jgi:hypothetical protein
MLRVLLLLRLYLVVPRVCAVFCAAPFSLESLPCLPHVSFGSCLDVEHVGFRTCNGASLVPSDQGHEIQNMVASSLPAVSITLVAGPGR